MWQRDSCILPLYILDSYAVCFKSLVGEPTSERLVFGRPQNRRMLFIYQARNRQRIVKSIIRWRAPHRQTLANDVKDVYSFVGGLDEAVVALQIRCSHIHNQRLLLGTGI